MGIIRDAWLKWKMLRLPWRKKFFVGQDLQGNTFWEFRDPLTKHRLRRIVERSPFLPKSHYGDVQITPQWHQWLRQTRIEAPSLTEQQSDILRQSQLKINARIADEKWASKARYIEKPKPQPQEMLKGDVRLDAAGAEQAQTSSSTGEASKPGMKSAVGNQQAQVEDPWEKAKQTGANRSGDFKPEGWVPGAGKKR